MNFNPGGLISGAGNYFTWKNPADAANPYLEQITGRTQGYLDPYAKAGQNSLGSLDTQFSKLLNNPGALMKLLASGYQESPGYQFNVDQATKAAKNMAAAGGMLGSQASQENLAGTVSGLANQDYNNYLSKVLGLYGLGLEGQQNVAGMGLNAGTNMANIISQQLTNQASNAYAGSANENEHWKDIFGDVGSFFGK